MLTGQAERVREVRGADEEDVDAVHRGDGLDLVEGGPGLDLDDGEEALVTGGDALVADAAEVHAAREEGDAALAGRLGAHPAGEPARLLGRVDLRAP